MYAVITKDLLSPKDGEYAEDNRDGATIYAGDPVGNIIKVRLLDDDRIPYYEADADDEVLENLALWAERDSGCTILQVREGNGWKDCIG